MVGTSSSLSSSCASFGSFEDIPVKPCGTVKFVCSYGGRILPRYPDGKLRHVGGETRILSVDRSVSFQEIQAKMSEICGWDQVNLRCQLPTDDLDALVSVTSDEDLANLIEEYDFGRRDPQSALKIRAFLHPTPVKSPKSPIVPPISGPMKGKSPFWNPVYAADDRIIHQVSSPASFSVRSDNCSGKFPIYGHQAHIIPAAPHRHLIHHGNYRR